jgi:hypothetical protein
MIQQRGWFLGAIVGVTLLIPGYSLAQDKAQNHPDDGTPARASVADSSKPGGPQALLARLAGEYNRIVRFVGQTGAAAAPSSGTAKISVVLGGRFILEESMDTVFGRPVEGLRLYGYNNVTKQYEMARMYTMSTAITMMKGTSSDGGKTIDFRGETDTSGTGKMPLHSRFHQVDDDQFVVTLSTAGPDGKESPFQETTYTRKK